MKKLIICLVILNLFLNPIKLLASEITGIISTNMQSGSVKNSQTIVLDKNDDHKKIEKNQNSDLSLDQKKVANTNNVCSAIKVINDKKLIKDKSLIRSDDCKIFYLRAGKRQYIPNLSVLSYYRGQEIVNVSISLINSYDFHSLVYPTGALIRGQDKQIFFIDKEYKYQVKNLEELRIKFFKQEIFNVNNSIINLYQISTSSKDPPS